MNYLKRMVHKLLNMQPVTSGGVRVLERGTETKHRGLAPGLPHHPIKLIGGKFGTDKRKILSHTVCNLFMELIATMCDSQGLRVAPQVTHLLSSSEHKFAENVE